MKTLQLILKNNWHKHFPIAMDAMAVLLFLFSLEDTLGYWGGALISISILAMACYAFEIIQEWRLPVGEKQSNKTVLGDVLAGVYAGAVCILLVAFLNIVLVGIIIVVVNLIGVLLHLYKKNQIKS